MNLLTDEWIPVRPQLSGPPRQIDLQTLLCGNDHWEVALPRDDMELAALQLLICLVQVLMPPKDKKQWAERITKPVSPEELATATQGYQDWFQVDHPEYPFMQMKYKKNNSKIETLEKLFTGLDTSENSKFVNEPNLVAAVCQSCCAIMLFNYANNSPSFGGGPDGGFKYGIRGTCAISTFTRLNDLRSTIWANIMTQEFMCHNIPGWKNKEFQQPTWLERIPEKGIVPSSSIDLLRGLFWQPGCLQLGEPISGGRCSCCGHLAPKRIEHFFRAPYGYKINGFWVHPHSPQLLTIKTKKADISTNFDYQRWNGSVPAWTQLAGIVVERDIKINRNTEIGQRTALVIKQFREFLSNQSGRTQLIVGGYRNSSAKIIERRHELLTLNRGWECHEEAICQLVDHGLKYLQALSRALRLFSVKEKGSNVETKRVGLKYKKKNKVYYSLEEIGKSQFYRRSDELMTRVLADIDFGNPMPTFLVLDHELKQICESVFSELTFPYEHDPELFRTLAIARRSMQRHIKEIRVQQADEDAA